MSTFQAEARSASLGRRAHGHHRRQASAILHCRSRPVPPSVSILHRLWLQDGEVTAAAAGAIPLYASRSRQDIRSKRSPLHRCHRIFFTLESTSASSDLTALGDNFKEQRDWDLRLSC